MHWRKQSKTLIKIKAKVNELKEFLKWQNQVSKLYLNKILKLLAILIFLKLKKLILLSVWLHTLLQFQVYNIMNQQFHILLNVH